MALNLAKSRAHEYRIFSANAITLASGYHFVTTEGVVKGLIFSRHPSAPSARLEMLEEKYVFPSQLGLKYLKKSVIPSGGHKQLKISQPAEGALRNTFFAEHLRWVPL